jgi:serine O-acetyltransferase
MGRTPTIRGQLKGFIGVLKQTREDWGVHQQDWTQPGFRAIAVHRIGAWLKDVQPKALRAPLFVLYRAMFRYIRNHYGIELPETTTVGRRFLISHQGGIVIHRFAQIGDDCLVRQNVTIGAASHDRWWEAPKLGCGVQVGCGAAILGKVTIGDGVRIGPNVVVMTDIPPGATVVAAPPRVIQLPKSRTVGKPETRVVLAAAVNKK